LFDTLYNIQGSAAKRCTAAIHSTCIFILIACSDGSFKRSCQLNAQRLLQVAKCSLDERQESSGGCMERIEIQARAALFEWLQRLPELFEGIIAGYNKARLKHVATSLQSLRRHLRECLLRLAEAMRGDLGSRCLALELIKLREALNVTAPVAQSAQQLVYCMSDA
jgi:hypothetical protein